MGFDAGRDAGVAGQRPAPRSALEPESSRTERPVRMRSGKGISRQLFAREPVRYGRIAVVIRVFTAEKQKPRRKRRETPINSSPGDLSVLCASAVNSKLDPFVTVSG
jgi:hypothetical protein